MKTNIKSLYEFFENLRIDIGNELTQIFPEIDFKSNNNLSAYNDKLKKFIINIPCCEIVGMFSWMGEAVCNHIYKSEIMYDIYNYICDCARKESPNFIIDMDNIDKTVELFESEYKEFPRIFVVPYSVEEKIIKWQESGETVSDNSEEISDKFLEVIFDENAEYPCLCRNILNRFSFSDFEIFLNEDGKSFECIMAANFEEVK